MTYLDRTIAPARQLLADRPARLNSADTAHPEIGPLLSLLLMAIDESRSVVVNVTAAHRGAGSSTVARKLAEAAAATGWCRVALLDAQPGPGGPAIGLVDTVERGEAPVLTPCPVGGLVIDGGRLSTDVRPLSRIDGVRKLYGVLRDQYSLVIVDCPAVLAGRQMLTIAAAADETVLVVEAGRTALAELARAREALEQRGAGVLGLVTNKSRVRVPALLGGTA